MNPASRQRGISLTELMVACALGLLVILATVSLLVVSRDTYVVLDEKIAVQETGHYALSILARSIRQASWTRWPPADGSSETVGQAGIRGLDARSLRMTSENIEYPVAPVSHGSDVLAIRFEGEADASMLNCAGFAVDESGSSDRGWSIFFVGGTGNSEPELRCKYRGKNSWRTEGIARGIESFQVLYGIDTDADGLPNQFMNASGVEQLNAGLGGDDADEGNTADYWHKVVAIRIAMLVRSSRTVRDAGSPPPYHLFGPAYSAAYGASDRGAAIHEADIPSSMRERLRKVFTATILLRNSALDYDG